jgi:hypothetical protein
LGGGGGGERGSVAVKALCYKPEGSIPGEVIFFFLIYLILPAALGPGVYSASNRNEYQKHKNNVSGELVRRVRRADKLTAICETIV